MTTFHTQQSWTTSLHRPGPEHTGFAQEFLVSVAKAGLGGKLFLDAIPELNILMKPWTDYHLPQNHYSYRPIVLEFLKNCNDCYFPRRRFFDFI